MQFLQHQLFAQWFFLQWAVWAWEAFLALVGVLIVGLVAVPIWLLFRKLHPRRTALFVLPFDGWIADITLRGFNREEGDRIADACLGRDEALRLFVFDPSRIKDNALRKRVLACEWPTPPPDLQVKKGA